MLRSCFSLLSRISSLTSTPLLLPSHHLNQPYHCQPHNPNLVVAHPISSSSSFYLQLCSCKDLKSLKQFHASIIVSTEFEPVSFASKLITFYTQFNDPESAVSVLKALDQPDTLTWNLILKSHVDLGQFGSVFSLYRRMRELGVEHDGFTFPIINRAVSLFRSGVKYGEMVHCVALRMGFGSDVYFCNTLIETCVKCGCVYSAFKVFDEMCHRDLVSWTSMISGYVCEGRFIDAFSLFAEMRMELEPNSVTVIIMLQACSSLGRVIEGRQVHGYVIKKGFLIDGSVQNSIFRMYTELGSEEEVDRLWSEINNKDSASWNILISFYSSFGDSAKVAESFNRMQSEQIKPSIETLTLAISAAAKSNDILRGNMLHGLAIKKGLYDHVLQASLLDFYAKCGELEASVQLFGETASRNSIMWSSMMYRFIQNGYFKEGVELFKEMQAAGLEPGAEMLINLVIVYTHLGALQLGKAIHGCLVRNLHNFSRKNSSLLETSILNMYLRCGSISCAKNCFDKMVIKDIVTWTSMIEGLGTHGLGLEALELFRQMLLEGMIPNSVTFLSLLSACSHSGLVNEGCEIFYSMKWVYGIEPDLDHYTCVVDLLGRSGKLKEALAVILKIVVVPDSRIWGALLASARVYEHRLLGEYAAKKLLELEPDNVGYYTVLSNVHAGDDRWDEVEEVRNSMSEKDLKKKPGWSCIESKGQIHGFVSGDVSHW